MLGLVEALSHHGRGGTSTRSTFVREHLCQNFFQQPDRMIKIEVLEKNEGQTCSEGNTHAKHCLESRKNYSTNEFNGSSCLYPDKMSLEQVCLTPQQGPEQPITNVISILQKCRKNKNLEYARQVHKHICHIGLQAHKIVGNYVVPMFVGCRSVFDAQNAFNVLLHHEEHAWTSLILGFIECGQPQNAFSLYRKMQEDGAHPSSHTLVVLLKACSRMKDLEKGCEIHEDIRRRGTNQNIFVGSTLVDMYARCGSIEEAQKVFYKLAVKNVVSWTALINGYVENGRMQDALKCYDQMQGEGVLPNAATFVSTLRGCIGAEAIDRGREIHAEIAKYKFDDDHFIGSSLVDMYAKCGSLPEAQCVFDRLSFRNVVCWTCLINGYAEYGFDHKALRCFSQMQVEGVAPNALTYICMLRACSSIGAMDMVRELHIEISRKGLERDLLVGNTLIDMYAKYGCFLYAHEVLGNLHGGDTVSWNALIAGYVENGLGRQALKCFNQMQLQGISPNNVTLACSLKACGSLQIIGKAREIHAMASQKGLGRDPVIVICLIDVYAKCGSLTEAGEAFDKLQVRDVLSWTAIIKGYGENGHVLEMLTCLQQMQVEGISPNAITFVCALRAACEMKDVVKGRVLHAGIICWGLERDRRIGNTLVDMYAKCDSLIDAEDFFERLPVRDIVSWNVLIAGYAENGHFGKALKGFQQMQEDGIIPSAVSFTVILKACGYLGAIDKGREIHTKIANMGLDTDDLASSSLVDMYVKCDMLIEACKIFNILPMTNVVSWTILMKGHVENGLDQAAMKCFEQMQLQGFSPNAVTFVCILKACSNMEAVHRGRELHTRILENRFQIDVWVGNALIGMYATCGSLAEAQNVFDKLPIQNVLSWNMLLFGYVENGLAEEALNCFEKMQLEGVLLNAASVVCSLKACGSIGAIGKGRERHIQIMENGFLTEIIVGNSLIGMYIKCGSLLEALNVFQKLPVRDIVSWNVLIVGYLKNGLYEEALECFKGMQEVEILPNATIFICGLKACSALGMVDMGRKLHSEIAQRGFEKDTFVSNTLISMYAKSQLVTEAQNVFDRLPIRNVVSWNALIAGYAEHGRGKEVLTCFDAMQQEGVCPDVVTFACGLKGCGSIGAIDKGQEIHRKVVQKGLDKDWFVGTTLIDLYAKFGLLSEAQEVFNKQEFRTVESWNALVSGYAENGSGMEALKYFTQMQMEGINPNVITLVSAIQACGILGAIDRGREIHMDITKKGLERDLFVSNTLIDMYAKCGSLREAQEVFDNISMKSAASWASIIRGCSMNHDGNKAVQCFEDMQKQGIRPDATTFTCLLTVCSRAALLAKAQAYFKLMKDEYRIVPTVDHYVCMVDLFARSGQLHAAVMLLETMVFHLSEEAWKALLSACRSYGDEELGRRCFQQLVKINPENSASYVLMANIYASAGSSDRANIIEEPPR